MLRILFAYALRDLLRVKLRTFFTILVISLVFALFILLTSIGKELSSQISSTLDAKNIDVIVQSKFASTPLSSSIPKEMVRSISSLEDVHESASLFIGKKRLSKDASLFILGFSDFKPIANRLGIGLVEGRAFHDDAREISIGQKVARILGLDIGDTLDLGDGAPYKITGIYSTGLDFMDACAYIGMKDAQRLLDRPGRVSILFISLKDPMRSKESIAAINTAYPKLVAFPSGELLQHLGSTKTLVHFIQLISIITFIVALAVLLNTLVMTVNERTREIGILSAIGWSRAMIVLMFTVEALLLSFSGGLLGYLLTFPAIYFLDLYPHMGLNFIPSSPSLEMFALLLVACLFIGLLSAIFPALYGTRMLPAKALHHD